MRVLPIGASRDGATGAYNEGGSEIDIGNFVEGEDMNLGEEKRGEVLILTADGRLDADTAGGVQGQIDALIDGGETRLLLDLTKLDYVSSAGLRVLLITAKRLDGSNGRFAICGLSDNVAEVFTVSGFDTIIDIHPDVPSALAAIGS